jgi:hypothetical protein
VKFVELGPGQSFGLLRFAHRHRPMNRSVHPLR